MSVQGDRSGQADVVRTPSSCIRLPKNAWWFMGGPNGMRTVITGMNAPTGIALPRPSASDPRPGGREAQDAEGEHGQQPA
ncbi:hypothetical protein ABZX77_13190 [Streptomyces sp. NPDC004237]|uniref:hypothetical protein n=1 Tax=Streptomyces sp. NPDC004237 TaxID=3154455 RepID=UPI0033A06BFC